MKVIITIFTIIALSQSLTSQCYIDRHHTTDDSSWQSCNTSNNPNPIRGNSHWIRYDLGSVYDLGQLHFWNYNVHDQTNDGANTIIIDYSTNGSNWNGSVSFNIPEADGTSFYEGVPGPNLNGISARYVLITIVTNHGGNCYGLSEVRMGIYEAPCTELVKTIHEVPVINGHYHAQNRINSKGLVNGNSEVLYHAGQQIGLNEGFSVLKGATFEASIENCNN